MLYITIEHIVYTLLRCVQTSSACVWHTCGAVSIILYAAHMQNECVLCAAHMQHV